MEFIEFQKDYDWVLKVLDSCMSEEQIRTSENLFNLFLNKWSEELSDERKTMFYSNFRKYKSHRMNIVKKVW